jgi:hypothetical protein
MAICVAAPSNTSRTKPEHRDERAPDHADSVPDNSAERQGAS